MYNNSNICILGQSRSGKTCYLYAVSHVLSQGINVNGHRIYAVPVDNQQSIRLIEGIESMANGQWPEGSINTDSYPFSLYVDGLKLTDFKIIDYRGGIFYSAQDSSQKEIDNLFDYFENSRCIVYFVDGDTLLNAMNPHGGSIADMNKLLYIQTLVQMCNERMTTSVPIILAITKSDIFSREQLEEGKRFLRDRLPYVFSSGNGMVTGITAVTLGKGLGKDAKGGLSGELHLNTDGNLHVPILFALLQEVSNMAEEDEDLRPLVSLMSSAFSPDALELYVNGQRGILIE